MMYSKIVGTGSYLPEKIFTNADWEARVQTTADWIVERTGIQERRIANSNETASSMATQAALKALEMAQMQPLDLQMIIVATSTPDRVFPATACLVQKELGCPTLIAFDIQAACTGFIYALSIADQYIKSGMCKSALVIGSEMMTRLVDWSDRTTCVLFGDGAGAVVLKASDEPGILSTRLYAEGHYEDLLTIDNAHVFNSPLTPEDKGNAYPYVKMQGQKLFKIAVTKLGEMLQDIQTQYQLTPDDIDWLIPHQANIRIIKPAAEKLGLSMDKVICTVDKHSNTSSASIPLALDVAVRDKRIKRGQMLLLEAFGAGLTWGSALVKF